MLNKKTKIYLIILAFCVLVIIIGNIIKNRNTFLNKNLKEYIEDNGFNKHQDTYTGSDNSFRSIHNGQIYESLITISPDERSINGNLTLDYETVDITYDVLNNRVEVIYENFLDDGRLILDDFEYDYIEDACDCESLSDDDISYCDEIKKLSDSFKNYYDNLISK